LKPISRAKRLVFPVQSVKSCPIKGFRVYLGAGFLPKPAYATQIVVSSAPLGLKPEL